MNESINRNVVIDTGSCVRLRRIWAYKDLPDDRFGPAIEYPYDIELVKGKVNQMFFELEDSGPVVDE